MLLDRFDGADYVATTLLRLARTLRNCVKLGRFFRVAMFGVSYDVGIRRWEQ